MTTSSLRAFILLLFLTSLFILPGCSSLIVHSKEGTETTVIMLRHTERTQISKMLTEKGKARARALVNAVGDRKIHAIYSPDIQRNLDTVQPLADYHGLKIIRVSRGDITDIPKRIAQQHAGETVVWVGNTFNLESLYWMMGGVGEPPDNYGDLFILTIPDKGETRVVKSRFGD